MGAGSVCGGKSADVERIFAQVKAKIGGWRYWAQTFRTAACAALYGPHPRRAAGMRAGSRCRRDGRDRGVCDGKPLQVVEGCTRRRNPGRSPLLARTLCQAENGLLGTLTTQSSSDTVLRSAESIPDEIIRTATRTTVQFPHCHQCPNRTIPGHRLILLGHTAP